MRSGFWANEAWDGGGRERVEGGWAIIAGAAAPSAGIPAPVSQSSTALISAGVHPAFRCGRLIEKSSLRLTIDCLPVRPRPSPADSLESPPSIGRASCRDSVCQYVSVPEAADLFTKLNKPI